MPSTWPASSSEIGWYIRPMRVLRIASGSCLATARSSIRACSARAIALIWPGVLARAIPRCEDVVDLGVVEAHPEHLPQPHPGRGAHVDHLGGGVPTLVDDDRDSPELGLERGIVVEDRVLEPVLGGGAEVFEPGLDVPLLDDVQDVGHVSSGLLGTGGSLLRSGSHIVYLRQCTVLPTTVPTCASSGTATPASASRRTGSPSSPTRTRPTNAGLEPIRKPADVVVMSSALDDAHSYWQQVPGDPRVVNALDAVARTGGARAGRRRRGRPGLGGRGPPRRPEGQRALPLRARRARLLPHGRRRHAARRGPARAAARPRRRPPGPGRRRADDRAARSRRRDRGDRPEGGRPDAPPHAVAEVRRRDRSRTSWPGAAATAW